VEGGGVGHQHALAGQGGGHLLAQLAHPPHAQLAARGGAGRVELPVGQRRLRHPRGADLHPRPLARADLDVLGLGPEHGVDQRPQVVPVAGVVELDHELVLAGVDPWQVLGRDGGDHAGPAVEVVVERGGVALAGRDVDLTQRDGIEPALGEEELGGRDDLLPRAIATSRHGTDGNHRGHPGPARCRWRRRGFPGRDLGEPPWS
jgi:hypothetical protein